MMVVLFTYNESMITKIQVTKDAEVIQCDFCSARSTERWDIQRCYGCHKDICRDHAHFENLDDSYCTVFLCGECIDSFRLMNDKRKKIDHEADMKKDKIFREWRKIVQGIVN